MEERNGTKFTWKIENFSCLKGEMLPSPTFSSHSLTWQVTINTSSLEGKEVIDISLNKFITTKEILRSSLAFLDSDGFPLIWKEKSFACRTYCLYTRQYDDECSKEVTFQNYLEKKKILV